MAAGDKVVAASTLAKNSFNSYPNGLTNILNRGAAYNLFEGINLPRIPVDEGSLTVGGAITLIAIALGTLLAAIAGGKAGERYHRRVDAAGYRD